MSVGHVHTLGEQQVRQPDTCADEDFLHVSVEKCVEGASNAGRNSWSSGKNVGCQSLHGQIEDPNRHKKPGEERKATKSSDECDSVEASEHHHVESHEKGQCGQPRWNGP